MHRTENERSSSPGSPPDNTHQSRTVAAHRRVVGELLAVLSQ
jgi:hypothetical protein